MTHLPETSPTDEPPAATAGEESHEDISAFVGEEADAPDDEDKEGES
ncbi:hypothetical protein [Amycolatopsis sp. CFH S0078]|nr:hypothetical protein [Amycolatopsis sp. CFH S0078]